MVISSVPSHKNFGRSRGGSIWRLQFFLCVCVGGIAGGGFISFFFKGIDKGRAKQQHQAYLRRRSREQLGLWRSRWTSCRRAIHRLLTPSLRCRRCNTGCNMGRAGRPGRHRSSSRHSKKLLPRNWFDFIFFLKSKKCLSFASNMYTTNRSRSIVTTPISRLFYSFLEPTRNVKRVLSKHNKLKMMKQFEKLKKKKKWE